MTDALGSLVPDNIVDWTIVLNSTHAANTTLTPSNSEKTVAGSVGITANATTLSFTIDLSQFEFTGTDPFPSVVYFDMQGDGLVLSNAPNFFAATDQVFSDRTAPWTQSFDAVTSGGGSVPEPATWSLLLTGFAASVWNRRRTQRSA